MKTDFNHGMDVRTIPLEKFPQPPEGYKWEVDDFHLSLCVPDEEYFYVRYDVAGGYIASHAEKEVVVFFIEAIRSVTAEINAPNETTTNST